MLHSVRAGFAARLRDSATLLPTGAIHMRYPLCSLLALAGATALAALSGSAHALSCEAPGLLALGLAETRDAGMLRVWLLQGNVPQDEKFEPGTGVADALAWYPAQLAEALDHAQDGQVFAAAVPQIAGLRAIRVTDLRHALGASTVSIPGTANSGSAGAEAVVRKP